MKTFQKITASAVFAAFSMLLSGCSELFVSTDAPELFTPSADPSFVQSDNFSPGVTDNSSDTPDPENSDDPNDPDISGNSSGNSAPAVSGEYSRHPRLLELEEGLSYNSDGSIVLSNAQQKLADSSLFVGDSICRGFSAYKVTKPQRVFAAGDVGARNFFDKDFFYNGEKMLYKDVLAKTDPEYIFLWMGMNDVNMTSAAEFCKNYEKIISLSLNNSSAKVIVCAVTPVSADSNFTYNTKIDEFNLAIQQYIPNNFSNRVSFLDFAYLLKNSSNDLSKGLDSGDGIHLAPECYYAAIAEMCSKLGFAE